MAQDSFSEKERRCRKRRVRKQNKEIQKRLGAFSIKMEAAIGEGC